MKNQKGNILMMSMIIFAIILIIMLLTIAVLWGNINGILQGVRTDLYLINKSAIISVNKNQGKVDKFSYNDKEYLKVLKESLRKNYHLNEQLESETGLIQKVIIEEYQIYRRGQKDSFTGKKAEGRIIHTVVRVKIKPIILEKQLEKSFTFLLHEDVYMEDVKVK